ncbi:MAG: hypothetical protein PUB45_06895 [Bacteroidales bacterium]|nr:hypothetical protein [Bacteroidales bacterium]
MKLKKKDYTKPEQQIYRMEIKHLMCVSGIGDPEAQSNEEFLGEEDITDFWK